MSSPRKISIAGDLGSGKSVVARELGRRLGWELVSTGRIQRRIAARMGLTTLELNRYSETHPEIDHEIDSHLRALDKTPEPAIVDSRMAWHFIPTSFKVYLRVALDVAAGRIFNDRGRQSERYQTLDDVRKGLADRRASEHRRFQTLYGVDILDEANYDLVVDTSELTPEEVVDRVEGAYRTVGEPVVRD